MEIKQLLDHRMDNFSYILIDGDEAAIIDPSFDEQKIHDAIEGLKIKYIILTHGHYDHVECVPSLKQTLNVPVVRHKSAMTRIKADIEIDEGDELGLGSLKIKVLHTPGHEPGSVCLLVKDKLFTGDTVFVGKAGRTDLPGSNHEHLIESIDKLKKLPDDTEIFPGHDYGDTPTSTIGREKRENPFFL